MPDPTGEVLLASGGRRLPHACQFRPEDAALGEQCPRLAQCLEALLPTCPCALIRFVLGPDGLSRLPFATANIKDVHGVDAAELAADTGPLFACVHPQDFDRVAISMTQSARAVRPWVSEYRILRPPRGALRWLRTGLVPHPDRNGCLVGYGLVLDVSAEKTSREDLLRLCEENAIGVFRFLPEGGYISANAHYARMCGFASPEALLASANGGPRQSLLVNPEERQALIGLLHARGSVERYALELRANGGGSVWISLNARAVKDGAGRTMYIEGFCADITEQMRREIAGGSVSEFSRTRIGARRAEKPARDVPDGLCHLLAYVREHILWRVRLPIGG